MRQPCIDLEFFLECQEVGACHEMQSERSFGFRDGFAVEAKVIVAVDLPNTGFAWEILLVGGT